MRNGLAWAGLLGFAAVGCAADWPRDGVRNERETIAGGTFDSSDHPAVFQEFTHWDNSLSACTASLIAPNVLLTARHCVAHGSSERVMCGSSVFGDAVPGSDTVVTGDAVPADASVFYRGVDVRVPSQSKDMCGFDVALIIINTPISPAKVTPLVPRIDRVVEPGEPYAAVGYGVDDKGQPTPGRMELADLSVRCLSGGCQMGFGVASTEFMGETGVCSGDSGGPALDADGKVIGVVSRGSDPCETPIYSQVAPWRDFITQTVLEAAASGGYQPPFWAFSGSSDLPAGLADAGEPCTDTAECRPGAVRYYQGSDTAGALCTPVCANGKECRPGFDVQGGGLCFDVPGPPPPDDTTPVVVKSTPAHGADDSCSLGSHPSAPRGPARVIALGVALALSRLRRRRDSAT